ncbi:DUF3396 domain-containing protein [Burkholderia humptydooensis]|uniref:DUF3396 domain-containing protein n=2 Tax=Burkholderia humptydooensis TaxID=430531 RepID=A0A7U4SSG8_9BURK|nr:MULTISPECIES: type VI immunity family protein [Burkholderia]AJY42409.1 hypothetical protein BW21_3193 [Burkholderia sp. 2002721687]ALX43626.1 hypothetical protein AQ610_15260 [Burkholderia humptydooensis]EIP90067.1 gp30 [Burkholderia humptydooensis MSMB43]QPS44445.1 DUF3396 domain-containing protein [Burkholderia humptydooensis]
MTMTNELLQRAQELSKVGMLPYALLEPRYAHDGIGAALTVRAALYFKGGYTSAKRQAIAAAFDAYIALARGAIEGQDSNPVTWLWFNGKRALRFAKAPSLRALEKRTGENEGFDACYVGGESARDASYFEFTTFCLEKFQADLGTRGLDVAVFSLPSPFVRQDPDAFVKLFLAVAAMLEAVHGHAGLAINLSPTGRTENESSEYYLAQRLGPGVDIGDPLAMEVRDLTDRIKTVDWLTLIDKAMLGKVGDIDALQSALPKDWYALVPCAQGLMIRAGVAPEAGVAHADTAPSAPPAYVVLNAALRPLVADTVSILQRGTVNGDAPVYNSKASSNAWLRRFDVSESELLNAKAAVLDTPRLPPAA